MNELALFAGAGGGILGGHLLGWRTVCAVEWEPYPASVLCARQNDGLLPPFPIWDDIQTFDGRPWAGIVDVVSGGFPCQDISAAGGGLALMENEAECGEKWRGSFVKYDPDSSLWRTHQCSLLGGLDVFSETWPQWGLMRDGECWEQQTLAQTIKGTVSGSWGTPTASQDFKPIRKLTPSESTGKHGTILVGSIGKEQPHLIGRYLKPLVTEYLMGWPIGWTDLKPLEMDKSHCAQQQLGAS